MVKKNLNKLKVGLILIFSFLCILISFVSADDILGCCYVENGYGGVFNYCTPDSVSEIDCLANGGIYANDCKQDNIKDKCEDGCCCIMDNNKIEISQIGFRGDCDISVNNDKIYPSIFHNGIFSPDICKSTCKNGIKTNENINSKELFSASLNDFWNANAFFIESLPMNYMSFKSEGNDIVVKDGVWYHIYRVYYEDESQQCLDSHMNEYLKLKLVMRTSTNHGKSWSSPKDIILPDSILDNCLAADPDLFYDVSTGWHILYQCLDSTMSNWNVCYAKNINEDPFQGEFVKIDTPSISGGEIWDEIIENNNIFDEGTTEIIEKRGEYFYVSFHGFDGVNGYRGVAKTKNFKDWVPINSGPIFDKDDCSDWNMYWNNEKCVGGGAATIFKEDNYYYQVIEVPTKNLGCSLDQQWAFAMTRSNNLESTNWEELPIDPLIVTSVSEKVLAFNDQFGSRICGTLSYKRLFSDNGIIYLLVSKGGYYNQVKDINDWLKLSPGNVIYKLQKNIPFAQYNFREAKFANDVEINTVESEIISRGNLYGETKNLKWDHENNYALFNGVNSIIKFENNPLFNLNDDFTINFKILFEDFPSSGSSLILGKLDSYWVELYPNKDLCFWFKKNGGLDKICESNLEKNKWYDFNIINNNNIISIYNNDKLLVFNTFKGEITQSNNNLQIGSEIPTNDYYKSFNGKVDYFKLYNFGIYNNLEKTISNDKNSNNKDSDNKDSNNKDSDNKDSDNKDSNNKDSDSKDSNDKDSDTNENKCDDDCKEGFKFTGCKKSGSWIFKTYKPVCEIDENYYDQDYKSDWKSSECKCNEGFILTECKNKKKWLIKKEYQAICKLDKYFCVNGKKYKKVEGKKLETDFYDFINNIYGLHFKPSRENMIDEEGYDYWLKEYNNHKKNGKNDFEAKWLVNKSIVSFSPNWDSKSKC
jgi:hypothetical protein